MNRKEAILNLRRVLIKRRDALRRVLAGDLGSLKEIHDSQPLNDSPDLDSLQDEISSQLAEVESRELSRTEYALERIREGKYGVCEACGTTIPMARLHALPYAEYCIKCQREMERQKAESSAKGDAWSQLLDLSSRSPDLSIEDIKLDD